MPTFAGASGIVNGRENPPLAAAPSPEEEAAGELEIGRTPPDDCDAAP